MKKRLYVDFHVLQTVPPSCINRDDTGSPKTAIYGGVTRARVSSQAWKHAMRQAFVEESLLDEEDVGKRTKKVTELVEKEIAALAPEKMLPSWPRRRWTMQASRTMRKAPRPCSSSARHRSRRWQHWRWPMILKTRKHTKKLCKRR